MGDRAEMGEEGCGVGCDQRDEVMWARVERPGEVSLLCRSVRPASPYSGVLVFVNIFLL